MKISNLFVLISIFLMVYITSGNDKRYITQAEKNQNSAIGSKSFAANLYNYKKQAFDKPFDKIIVIDTITDLSANKKSIHMGGYDRTDRSLAWTKDNEYGVKYKASSDVSFFIKNNTLYIYTEHRNSAESIFVYSPRLLSIQVQNTNLMLQIIEKKSLDVMLSDDAVLEVKNTDIKELSITAKALSQFTVVEERIDKLLINLEQSSGTVRSDSCAFLEVRGDAVSNLEIDNIKTAYIYKKDCPKHKQKRNFYHLMYNDELGWLKIKTLSVGKVTGDFNKLTFYQKGLADILWFKEQLAQKK